ncbi:MAG: signal recognition particle protein Srp54 [Candidatus Freyrarchaeum guaymaensis]|nr:signal recognition particle protein Srp54 [Candidatus Sigynarchaeota archaeon]
MVLEKLGEGLRNAINKILRSNVADKAAVEELTRELQRALLTSDVNVELVFEISERIRKRALDETLPPGISRREHIVKIVYDELTNILGRKAYPLEIKPGKTNIIMLVGIQGSGKTTTVAKLARYLSKRGIKTGVVCADTFRPGAYEQLYQLVSELNIPFYGDQKSKNSVAVAKKGIEKLQKLGCEAIIVDTSGRHKEEKGLMKEMQDIAKAIHPQEIILVVDGTLGQQASVQAQAFKQATDVGSIIVTKLDGSARGGGALSAVAATGAPIKFIGTGEKIEDIESFNPTGFVGRLLGMGDLQSLLEKVREAELSTDKDAAMAFLSGRFTLKDFYNSMEQLRKMGPISKVLELLGVGAKIPKELKDVAEDKMGYWKVMLQSMTKEELVNPKIIDRSRIIRIARGSGTQPKEVKELIDQYFVAKKMAKMMGKRRMRGKHGMQIPAGITPEQIRKWKGKLA